MRYVIIGAGAVGTIGVRLSQAGRDVTLVARGAHLDAVRRQGLLLAAPDGEHTARYLPSAVPLSTGIGRLRDEGRAVLAAAGIAHT